MKPEIKALWIAALTSGEYKQGRARLRTTWQRNGKDDLAPKFCCLGVLSDLAAKAGVGRWNDSSTFEDSRGYVSSDVALTPGVCAWAGITPTKDGDVLLGGRTASSYNDGGLTFPEIAELIDLHL